jgi:hypothetical protein
MLEVLIDNVFLFSPTSSLIHIWYEVDFIQGHFKKNEKKLVWSFNFTLRFAHDGHGFVAEQELLTL